MKTCWGCFLALIVAASPAFAQSNPFTKDVTDLYEASRLNLVETAELVSEADYGFKPTPEVRTIGQLVGHVANAQYFFCSSASGQQSPNSVNIEQDVTDKAGLVRALNESFAYCDEVHASMTDAIGLELIDAGSTQVTKLSRLIFNVAHNNEHYGNLVTYMRLKGMVPPSTARTQSGQ